MYADDPWIRIIWFTLGETNVTNILLWTYIIATIQLILKDLTCNDSGVSLSIFTYLVIANVRIRMMKKWQNEGAVHEINFYMYVCMLERK